MDSCLSTICWNVLVLTKLPHQPRWHWIALFWKKKVKQTRCLLICFFKYHKQKYQNVFPRTKTEFSGLWLVAALSCPTAILNWLGVDGNHINRVTFITSLVAPLHWVLKFPRSDRYRFFHFVHDLQGEIMLREAGMSLSARRVTLPAVTPVVLQNRVCDFFPLFLFHFSYFFATVCLLIH